jgi:hypothetical protein
MKATKKAAVTETKVVEIEPAKIILELTEVEAKVLGAIMGGVNNKTVFLRCRETYEPFLKVNSDSIPISFSHTIYDVIVDALKKL